VISFSRIVREQFVVLPRNIEKAQQIANPHLYQKNLLGELVRKKSFQGKHAAATESSQFQLDMEKIRDELSREAAVWSVEEFEPHLSLVYSKLHPIDNALWRTIRERVLDFVSIDDCDLDYWNVEGNGFSWERGVLKLMLCEGDVSEWVMLGSVDLHV
ncbi:hypothetical protein METBISCDRAFT_20363, partial [Metschnikowia bicuspidata]